MNQTISALDGVPLFALLDPAERDALARVCTWRRYGPHEQILGRDEASTDVLFVISGSVRIVIYSLAGREIAFNDLTAGQFFGELSAIDGELRSADAVALEPTEIASLRGPVFLEAVTEHPELARAVLRQLAGFVRRSTTRILELSTLGANNRVHGDLLRLARRHTTDGRSAIIRPIPLHGDIAARVSTARETVARVFGDLTRAGIVERRADHLMVRDIRRLEQMVQEVRGEAGLGFS